MSEPVENSTRAKAVKIAEETWRSVSHEAIDRRSGIGDMISIAWNHFCALPEPRREKLAREFETESKESAA